MISNEQATKQGIEVINTSTTQSDAKQELIAKVKQLLPNIVNSDNHVDVKALNDLFNITNTTSNNQGYELTFAGKGLARAKADEDTNLELKIEEKQSKEFAETGNVIIRGDNIDVLKILCSNYHQAIKMIYIDPPYNTKSENFIYNDNFKQSEEQLIEEFGLSDETSNFLESVYGTRSHSGWLSFMYPRLKIAKDLLKDDGVIFISIDDNEQANLKIMCDEIFGENNFIGILKWKRKKQPSFLKTHLAGVMEYVFIISKNKSKLEKLSISNVSDSTKKVVNLNNLVSERFFKAGVRVKCFDSGIITKGKYKIKTTEIEYLDDVNVKNGKATNDFRMLAQFTNTQEKINGFVENELIFITTNKSLRRDVSEQELEKRKSITDLLLDGWGDNQESEKEIEEVLGNKDCFEYPKPTKLIQNLVKSCYSSNDIILDFFSGSGTTAHAVMQLNAEDGGNRRFILVQLDEAINPEKSKSAYEFCTENKFEPVISSITIERVNRAGDKIKAENPDKNIDIGYKVFSLTDKAQVHYNIKQSKFEFINKRKNHLDTLYNMLVATVKPLDTTITTIKDGAIYQAGSEIYIIGKVSIKEIEIYKDQQINIDSMADFNLEDYLNLNISQQENIRIIY